MINAWALEAEFAWLEAMIDYRWACFIAEEGAALPDMPLPNYELPPCPYAEYVEEHGLGLADRLVLLLVLAAQLRPELLDPFFTQSALGKPYTEFGGVEKGQSRGFLPTGLTALFLLTDGILVEGFSVLELFAKDHAFARTGALRLGAVPEGEPYLSGKLELAPEWLARFTTVKPILGDASHRLPARRVETEMEWADLILPKGTMQELQAILDWLEFGEALERDLEMGKRVAPGHKCLFYGPPGTGKTLTASLLGKAARREVWKIDLSMLVSKYIGETEKNLAKVFEQAEARQWILFFDEADALFGRRTELHSSNDRHANQEVSYLLQRMEVFPGLVILASNLKDQIDGAFLRRFHSMVPFPLPGPEERARLWASAFSSQLPPAEDVDVGRLAGAFAFSGGHIVNAVRFASLRSLRRGLAAVPMAELEAGGRKELHKTGVELW